MKKLQTKVKKTKTDPELEFTPGMQLILPELSNIGQNMILPSNPIQAPVVVEKVKSKTAKTKDEPKAENTVYVSSKKIHQPGTAGSFALYSDEHGTMKSAGLGLVYDPDKESLSVAAVDSNSVSIDTLNIRRKRVITSSKGEKGDKQGDIVVNENYIYYCTKNYTGKSNIWVRWNVSDSEW